MVIDWPDGEGSFFVRIIESTGGKSVNRVSFFFSISQSIRDSALVYSIAEAVVL